MCVMPEQNMTENDSNVQSKTKPTKIYS